MQLLLHRCLSVFYSNLTPMPNSEKEIAKQERVLIAIGGNATHPTQRPGTIEEQIEFAVKTGEALLPILESDRQLIITHGNGPVVGKILMRQVLANHVVPPMSMDVCVAHSQGGIAYLLMQNLENALRRVDNSRHVVCLLTQVEIDPDDPSMQNPTKPVGFFYTEEQAADLSEKLGWYMAEDSGRGWRYTVPSPKPKHIVDISLIETIANSGAVVIAGGGGGIPVVRHADGTRTGIEAVIDKDLTSALMANVMHIDTLLILTAIDAVKVHYGTDKEARLDHIQYEELYKLHQAGEFSAGSMGPKVEAVLNFLQGGGKRAVIAHLEQASEALEGKCGTQVTA